MKAVEIRELAVKELKERIEAEKSLLVKQKINHAISPMDNPTKIRYARKNIARMMTVLRQKQLSEKKSKD
jgi:large subunit ribosomal protein L29